jgi:hypothetical protein
VNCCAANLERSQEAKRIYQMPCCRDNCLHFLGKKRGEALVASCIEEVDGLDRNKKHDYLFQKLLHSTDGVDDKGTNYYCYFIIYE